MDKTKNFKFNLEEKNVFCEKAIQEKRVGTPRKKNEEKLTKQYSIKFTSAEQKKLKTEFIKKQNQFSSFASFLRFKVLNS